MNIGLVALALFVSISPVFGQTDPAAIVAVEAFCKYEFDGNDAQRIEMIDLSEKEYRRLKKELREDGNLLLAVYFQEDPATIVKGYKILSVVTKGSRGSAEIAYEVLGEVEGNRGKANKVVKSHEALRGVTLKLVSDKRRRRWWIQDPPRPKVSKEAILRILKADLDRSKNTLERNKGESLPHLEELARREAEKIAAIEAL